MFFLQLHPQNSPSFGKKLDLCIRYALFMSKTVLCVTRKVGMGEADVVRVQYEAMLNAKKMLAA